MKHSDSRRFVQSHGHAIGYRGRGCHPPDLAAQARFAEELPSAQNRNHGFLTLLRYNRQFKLAFLNVKQGVRGVALRKNGVIPAWIPMVLPLPTLARNAARSKRVFWVFLEVMDRRPSTYTTSFP